MDTMREDQARGRRGPEGGVAGGAAGLGSTPDDRAVRQAYHVLHLGFIVAPLLAGADKFFGLLAEWEQYLWSGIPDLLNLGPTTFMGIVGVVEIAAAGLVAVKPRIGAWVVAGWLAAIIVNLLLVGAFFDVALRDLGLLLGAVALARLASVHSRPG